MMLSRDGTLPSVYRLQNVQKGRSNHPYYDNKIVIRISNISA